MQIFKGLVSKVVEIMIIPKYVSRGTNFKLTNGC